MFWSDYRNYPLLSNNVGIDFTELGHLHGTTQKPVSKDQGNEKQDELSTIGFRVKPKEKAIIQDYFNRMYNQLVVDPKTAEQQRVLDVTKLVTFSYMTV